MAVTSEADRERLLQQASDIPALFVCVAADPAGALAAAEQVRQANLTGQITVVAGFAELQQMILPRTLAAAVVDKASEEETAGPATDDRPLIFFSRSSSIDA